MRDREGQFGSLPQAVRAAGGSLHADDAAQVLFRTREPGGPAGRRVVLALAASNPALEIDSEGMVRLAEPQPEDTPLPAARFVVVDVETTGSRPAEDRVTEIGVVRVEGGCLGDTFESLVRSDHPVPPAIARLTGIHELLLASAPRFSRISGRLVDFLGNETLVAHNAAFDTAFLAHELERSGEPPLRNPVLCTLKLARRMLPDLRSWKLDSIAAHFGFRFRARHRAMGDAEVTARILTELLIRAEALGVRSLGALLLLGQRRSRRRPGSSPGSWPG